MVLGMAKKHGDLLGKYCNQLEASRRWRWDEGFDDLWDRLIDLYAGKHFDHLSDVDRIAVNIAFSTVNVIYPSTTINHPKITLQARTPEGYDKATIAEAVVDYLWKSDDISAGDEMRLAVKDFLVIGHGWVKTGWRYVASERPRDPADIAAEYEQKRTELDEAAVEAPELADDLPGDEDI